jgi:hypothetical protein
MKLADLAAEPKLIPVTLDSESIVEKYGEALEFWILDRQPIDKYLQMARVREDNMDEMVLAVNEMILNEEGTPIVSEGKMLPSVVLMEAFTKVIEALGK